MKIVPLTRTCTKCGLEKNLLVHFSAHARGKYGRQPSCRACGIAKDRIWRKANPEKYKKAIAAWHAKHPESHRKATREYARRNWHRYLEKRFNVSKEQYEEMFLRQNGRCAICHRETKKRLSVDHNHETNKIRGLLCTKCNLGLGIFKDNSQLLLSAVGYLAATK